MRRKQMWLCLATVLGAAAFMGCTPKNRGDVCDRETSDSIKIGGHAFAMDSDSIVQIGDVRWRLNQYKGMQFLLTSVSIDSPKMKSVIQLIDSIYGEHETEDDLEFYWNGLKLRNLHSERECGTVMSIY